MEKISPNCYIRLHKTICHPIIIHTINRFAGEWGVTPADAAYRILTEACMSAVKRKAEVDALKKD